MVCDGLLSTELCTKRDRASLEMEFSMKRIVWLSTCFFSLSVATSNNWPLAEPNYSVYHQQDALLQSVKEIVDRHPTFMKMENMEKTVDNYSVSLPVVTMQPGGWTTSQENKIRILMSFGEHGREFVSSELGLRLLQCFDGPAQLRTCIRNTTQYDIVQSILERVIFKIIPIENPRGRERVENGELCQRKNGRDVDINRNWDIDFGVKELDYDPNEEYGGEFAFSEPETMLLKELASGFTPHVWVAVHSGMCAVFMPYDRIGEMPTGPSAEAQFEILRTMKTENLLEECEYGPGGKTVGYVAHGTATDYMYSVLHVPLAFTWEIYGDMTAKYEDCFRMFNPLTLEELRMTLSMWIATIFKFIQLLPDHPDIQRHLDRTETDQSSETDDLQKTESAEVKDASEVQAASHAVIESSFQTMRREKSFEIDMMPLMLGLTPLILGMVVVLRLFAGRPRFYRNRSNPP